MDQCDREVPDQQAVSVRREETCHLCQNCDARCPFLSSDAHGVRLALALDLRFPLGGGQAGLPDSQRDCEVKRTCVGSGDAKTDLPAWDPRGSLQCLGSGKDCWHL